MATELQSSFGSAVRGVGVTFRDFFNQADLGSTMMWEPVVKTLTDNAAQATFSGKTGAGTLSRFSEGASVPKKNRYKLYDTAFVHDQYGGQIEVTRLMLMNRDWSSAFDEFKDLVRSAAQTKSKAPAQIFNGGFATTTSVNGIKLTTYADGKPLFSTVHPRVDGGSAQSNASSTSIPLTENNLETARIALLQQLQDDGNPIELSGPLYLVVPTNLLKKALVYTMSELKPETANNDTNIYSGGTINVLHSRWLDSDLGGSATAWFLVAPSVAKLGLMLRQDAQTDQSVDKNTKSTLFDVILDFSVGSYAWHGTWGSKGTSAAYSS